MQIDANDAAFYMQISHATVLWLLFFGDREKPVCLWSPVSNQFIFGSAGVVCVKTTSEGYKRPVLAAFT